MSVTTPPCKTPHAKKSKSKTSLCAKADAFTPRVQQDPGRKKNWALQRLDGEVYNNSFEGDFNGYNAAFTGTIQPSHSAFTHWSGPPYSPYENGSHMQNYNCYCSTGHNVPYEVDGSYTELMCYHCGSPGHYASHCPRGDMPALCFFCHQAGHFQVACPMRYESFDEEICPTPTPKPSRNTHRQTRSPRSNGRKNRGTRSIHNSVARNQNKLIDDAAEDIQKRVLHKDDSKTTRSALSTIMKYVKKTDVVKAKLENSVGAYLAEQLPVFSKRPNGGRYTKLGPLEYGILTREGMTKVKVYRRPRVAILHIEDLVTNEKCEKGEKGNKSCILQMLIALIRQAGAEISTKIPIPISKKNDTEVEINTNPSRKSANINFLDGVNVEDLKKKLVGSEMVIVTNSAVQAENSRDPATPPEKLSKTLLQMFGTVVMENIAKLTGVSFGTTILKGRTILICSLPENLELCCNTFQLLLNPILGAMHGVTTKKKPAGGPHRAGISLVRKRTE